MRSNEWRVLVLCGALAFGLAPAGPALAEIRLLAPGPEGADSAPYSFIPSLPRGNRETQFAFTAEDENGFDHTFETFLKFELPPDLVGPGESVSLAVLWVFFAFSDSIFGEGSSAPGELRCHEVLEPWDENTLTWTNKPDYGPVFDTHPNVTGMGLLWCNVTEQVAAWAAGTRPNHGIALSNPTDRVIGFWAFETPPDLADPIFRPRLAIDIDSPDDDDDGVLDVEDDCQFVDDPDQRDTDQDGFGNACDADVDQNGGVGAGDFVVFRAAYGSSLGQPAYDEDVDFDGDGSVGVSDFVLLRTRYGKPPGPSGYACAGSVPCP